MNILIPFTLLYTYTERGGGIYLHRVGGRRLGAKMWRTILLHKSVWAQDRSGKKRLQVQMPDRTFAGLHMPEPVDLEVAKYQQKKTLLGKVGFNNSYKGIEFLQQFSTPYKTLCRRPLIFQTMNSVRTNSLSLSCQKGYPLRL